MKRVVDFRGLVIKRHLSLFSVYDGGNYIDASVWMNNIDMCTLLKTKRRSKFHFRLVKFFLWWWWVKIHNIFFK